MSQKPENGKAFSQNTNSTDVAFGKSFGESCHHVVSHFWVLLAFITVFFMAITRKKFQFATYTDFGKS